MSMGFFESKEKVSTEIDECVKETIGLYRRNSMGLRSLFIRHEIWQQRSQAINDFYVAYDNFQKNWPDQIAIDEFFINILLLYDETKEHHQTYSFFASVGVKSTLVEAFAQLIQFFLDRDLINRLEYSIQLGDVLSSSSGEEAEDFTFIY